MAGTDIMIAGGGPAGCSAGLALRALGLSVAVFDAPEKREKPAETSAPQLRQMLESLGASFALQACEPCLGIASDWGRDGPALNPSLASPHGHGWFVRRARFDHCLREAAEEAGVLWIGEELAGASIENGQAVLWSASRKMQAPWLIFATGSPALAARATSQTPVCMDQLIGFWARLPVAMEERWLLVETCDSGWWYLCPDEGGQTTVCLVTDPRCARDLDASRPESWNHLLRGTQLGSQLAGCREAAFINTVPISVSRLPSCCAPGWIAAGDAAIKLDPVGSSGVATALAAGRRAAHAAAGVLSGRTEDLEPYRAWITRFAETFAAQRRKHYELEAGRRPSGFWSRRLQPVQQAQQPA